MKLKIIEAMSLRIVKVINDVQGHEEEYVGIRILSNTNLKHYALVDNSFDKLGQLSNKHRHFYRFPDYEVDIANDAFIRVYSGDNDFEVIKNDNNKNILCFYTGSNTNMWNNDGDKARLLKITEISSFDVPSVE